MWLFVEDGFFSVAMEEEGDRLKIRARVAADLDALRERHMPELSETRVTPQRDYPFRATIDRGSFGAGLARIGGSIRYENFKERVRQLRGSKRAEIYSCLWRVIRDLERMGGDGDLKPAAASLDEIEDMMEEAWAADERAVANSPEVYAGGQGVLTPIIEPDSDGK